VIVCADTDEAVAAAVDGATVLVGGFGMAGMPVSLIDALIRQGATDLTVVSNNTGNGDTGLAALLAKGRCGRRTARNFGPVMATAATTVVAQVREVVATGELDPEAVATPGIHVDRVVAA
jgi:acyl CoA:acetate/3-ketoacid CoA transferase alpha subunit